jgi:hypothetical protein
MCPDKQFLSVYFDGELPSPWKERMEQHIEICSECGETLKSYKRASEFLRGAEDDGVCAASMEAAQARVWEKISSRTAKRRTPDSFTVLNVIGKTRWRAPAAFAAIAGAAAAALIITVTTLLPSGGGNPGGGQPALSVAENFENITVSSDYDIDIPDITPFPDMDSILRYLETDDSSNIVIIKLPERKKFNRYGDPAFINAADYSRGLKD